jgi:predicted alpha/beta-fold hydrolase
MTQASDEDILKECSPAQADAIRSYLELRVGWSIHEVQKRTGVVILHGLRGNLESFVLVNLNGKVSRIS